MGGCIIEFPRSEVKTDRFIYDYTFLRRIQDKMQLQYNYYFSVDTLDTLLYEIEKVAEVK